MSDAQTPSPSGMRAVGTGLQFRRMRLILALCLLEVVPAIVLILFYLNINLLELININQMVMFCGIVALTRGVARGAFPFIAFVVALLFISIIKSFALTGLGDYNFQFSAVFTYFLSLVMPALIITSVFSQKDVSGAEVLQDLRWFSKWFLIIITPILILYAILNMTGRIVYFGFGVNFHYVVPYFLTRGAVVAMIATLILLSGKRAVLINFLIQLSLFLLGKFRRSPVPITLVVMFLAAVVAASWDSLEFFLRRFTLMIEALASSDLSGGLLGLANSYEAILLFGGRLEEVVGIFEYFVQHPGQIWFGSPPGANFVWRVDISDFETEKSFAHLTWLGYFFRFGLVPTVILIIYLLYRMVVGWNTQSPIWLVFVGILSSATFGANLFYSPVAWTMIALYLRFGPAIAQEIRRESGQAN